MAEVYDESSIKVLEGLEAVRLRPAMYIGSTTQRGLNHLVYEIVDNAIDEHCQGYGNTIHVTFDKNHEGDIVCSVDDNGRGIPVGIHPTSGLPTVRTVLTTLHAGGKFDSESYTYSSGLHGVGSSVVNALSEWMKVEIRRDGRVFYDEYIKGKPSPEIVILNGELPNAPLKRGDKTGTRISFKPDKDIFNDATFNVSDIKKRLHEVAYLNPALEIVVEDNSSDVSCITVFKEPDGIGKYLSELSSSDVAIHDPYRFSGEYETENGVISVEVVFKYVESIQERIIGFCNNVRNHDGGSHITGLKSAFTSTINAYARQSGFLKDKDDNFTGADVRSGLNAVVVVKHPDPEFEGQTKTKLNNSDAQKAVSAIVSEELSLFFDKNPQIMKNIITSVDKSAKLRRYELKKREGLFTTKKKFSIDSNGKLANCESTDPKECELYIVEGDSAAGSGKMGRDRRFQAILPIRGKILNVEKASIDKILANAEIRSIIDALGCGFLEGYGNDFDISKLRYHKICINCDSDLDGAHITTLLLTVFYRLFPELIKNGHVYVAVSPLYRVTMKNGDFQYIYTENDLKEFVKTHRDVQIQRFKGLGEMSPAQLWETTLNPVTRVLKRVIVDDDFEANRATSDLMGSDTSIRKRFIFENAENADVDS